MGLRIRIPKVLLLSWRHPRPFLWLCMLEFPMTVACLALFGIADPNTYRTKLWKEGYKNGWNSDPVDILYAIANYKPVDTPHPWNQLTTDYNVAISVLCMFFLLTKTTLYILNGLPPFSAALLHGALLSVYAVSAYWQAGPDYLSKEFPSRAPWYITRGCGPPANPALYSSCQQARAAFAMAICMSTLYGTYFFFSAWQAIPSEDQRAGIRLTDEEATSPSSYNDDDDEKWEFDLDKKSGPSDSPAIPMTPMTPRTQAFNTLSGNTHSRNRDLPLRHHIAMGDDVYQGTKGKAVSR